MEDIKMKNEKWKISSTLNWRKELPKKENKIFFFRNLIYKHLYLSFFFFWIQDRIYVLA